MFLQNGEFYETIHQKKYFTIEVSTVKYKFPLKNYSVLTIITPITTRGEQMYTFKVEFMDEDGKLLPRFTRRMQGETHWDVCVHVLTKVLRRLKGAVDFNVTEV